MSTALRVCLAARELGLDLTAAHSGRGRTGDPCEGARDAAGWRARDFHLRRRRGRHDRYGCAKSSDVTDVHLQSDALALFTYPYRVEPSGVTVPAFNLTTVLDTASKILLNVQIDDYGIVEQRSCGCELDANGFTTHVREFRSYSKLVGEGITLMGNEMIQILEHVLPARFGGSPLDYQLLEEEDERGFTRLNLLIARGSTFATNRTCSRSCIRRSVRDRLPAIWCGRSGRRRARFTSSVRSRR